MTQEDPSNARILRPQPHRPGAGFCLPTNSAKSSPSLTESAHVETPTSSTPSTPLMDPRSNTNLDVGGPAPTSIPDHMRGLESNGKESEEMPQKSRSILNLTSSTLFGIYSPAGYDANREEPIPLTPWGTGAQTPSRTTSVDISAWKGAVEKLQATSEKNPQRPESSGKRRRSMRKHHRPRTTAARLVMLASRTAALFVSGLAYGEVISHLHDSGNIAPVRVDGIRRDTWEYLVFWGFAGAVLGSLLPVLDSIERRQGSPVAAEDERSASPDSVEDDGYQEKEGNGRYARQGRSGLSAEWNPIVRSIGAFVGIAFAIRRLPWQSTTQVSLTLALVNPVIWYLIDRTRPGFLLASLVGLAGAATLLGLNPSWIPSTPTPMQPSSSPRTEGWNPFGNAGDEAMQRRPGEMAGEEGHVPEAGLVRYETVGAATWISSVLFCSCIFFGNIGRRWPSGGGGGRGVG